MPRDLQHQEVIFLLDTSQSMVESDPLRLIPETVLEMSAILPRNCAVGIYSYSDEVHKLQPMAGLSGLPSSSFLQQINWGIKVYMLALGENRQRRRPTYRFQSHRRWNA